MRLDLPVMFIPRPMSITLVDRAIDRCRSSQRHMDISYCLLALSRRLLHRGWWISGGADVDGNGNKTTYNYDAYGRLYQTHYPDLANVGQSSSTDFEQYTYDVNSRVTSTQTRSGSVIGTPRDALGL